MVRDIKKSRLLQGRHNVIYLEQYFGWPDEPSSGLDVTKFKNEITILYSGECRNTSRTLLCRSVFT